jgi:ribosomal protein S12 methylthiotransferase accessory factor YcaO
MHVLEVRNAELMESITRQAAEQGITDAAIVALIGAIDSFTVSTNPATPNWLIGAQRLAYARGRKLASNRQGGR